MSESFYFVCVESTLRIIDPQPILCLSDPLTPKELRAIIQESKDRMEKEVKLNRLYNEAGKYFIEKYSKNE